MANLSLRVDLNADMGESFGVYRLGADEELVQHITSANIACGYHAGDPSVMRRTVKLCLEAGVGIGAHPGLPDLSGFGRRMMQVSPEEVYDLMLYQIGALQAIARAEGGSVRHVKPHGALYNMAAVQPPLADAIAEAVLRLDPTLMLFGLAGSELIRAAERKGLRAVPEAFADRTYTPEGTLTPRGESGALLHDPEQAAAQVLSIVRDGLTISKSGSPVSLQAETFCIHGDGPGAAQLAAALKLSLIQHGVEVKPVT
ncbi:LamB/YcsF family protein [Paenibacillus sp. YYML68]|uniref:LamB/YcsF family protein n=1 Tax=Paenibacillus sp. YYML68 TaxID=2909250 RepID=UPI002490963C|nr:5-oxoprolinase subunit PxpA [Paenibacillus sp. YYML68]